MSCSFFFSFRLYFTIFILRFCIFKLSVNACILAVLFYCKATLGLRKVQYKRYSSSYYYYLPLPLPFTIICIVIIVVLIVRMDRSRERRGRWGQGYFLLRFVSDLVEFRRSAALLFRASQIEHTCCARRPCVAVDNRAFQCSSKGCRGASRVTPLPSNASGEESITGWSCVQCAHTSRSMAASTPSHTWLLSASVRLVKQRTEVTLCRNQNLKRTF